MALPSTSSSTQDLAENGTLQNGSTTKLYGANPPPAWSHRKYLFTSRLYRVNKQYGNTGCGVFQRGIQKLERFLAKNL